MATPTVEVTVDLATIAGEAIEGVTVRARLDGNEVYEGIVVSKSVSAVTDANGVAVLDLFPNALDPVGLGTQGTTYRFTAAIDGGRSVNVRAVVPNEACRLENILVDAEPVTLSAAELALAQAQTAVTTAATSAAAAELDAAAAALSYSSAAASAATASSNATAAAASATSAASSAASAAHIYSGSYTSDPTTRPDGSAIQTGDQYFNSSDSLTKRYNGATWVASDLNTADLAVSGGSALIGFIQSEAGAVALTLQAKLRGLEISLREFGAVGDGSDETDAIQSAIDAASARGGITTVRAEPGKTYVVSGLVPKSNVLLDLNGSTIQLANNALVPILDDSDVGNGSNFGVINGTLDCNQDNNHSINRLGGMWLTGWTNLRFENLTITECYRVGLYLTGCTFVKIDGYTFRDSGLVKVTPGIPNFAYALSIDAPSRYIDVRNVKVQDVYGFGIHFFACEDYTASNLSFENLTYSTTLAIAITFTEAKRGRVSNVDCASVEGDNIEINCAEDLDLENVTVDTAGNRPLLTGDNSGTGIYNKRVRVRNFTTTSTGGTYSGSLSYLIDSEFEGLNFDKGISGDTASTSTAKNKIRDATIGSTVAGSVWLVGYGRFLLEDVRFSNYTFQILNRNRAIVTEIKTLAAAAVHDIPFATLLSSLMTFDGSVAGTLRTLTRFSGSLNQGSFQECKFLVNDAATAANLSAVTTVNSAVARALTIAGDAANKKITLTNGSGVELNVAIELDMVLFR